MARVSYHRLRDPEAQFRELQPAYDRLKAMQRGLRPFGQEWIALDMARKGLEAAALLFTGNRVFFEAPRQVDFSAAGRKDDVR